MTAEIDASKNAKDEKLVTVFYKGKNISTNLKIKVLNKM